MPEKKAYFCQLCNSSLILDSGECQICGGKQIKYLGFNIGYIYPAEEKYVKFLISAVIVILVGFIFGIILLATNLDRILSGLL